MKKSSAIRRLFVVVFLALLALALAAPSMAADMRNGDVVTVSKDTTIEDNLYVSASTITIDGVVNGDVMAAGSQITVNGTVKGNLFAGGQTVIINGTVRDVIVGAQSVQLGSQAHVTGNVTSGSSTFESKEGSAIDGDLLVFGNQALLGGRIGRDITGAMNGLELRGVTVRNISVYVGDSNAPSMQFMYPPAPSLDVQGGLTLADNAQVGGKLEYGALNEARMSKGAKVEGNVTRKDAPDQSANSDRGFSVLTVIRRFVTLLLIGLLLVWLAPNWLRRMDETIRTKPLPSLGFGALTLIIVVALLILIPIVGILIAVLLGLLTLSGIAVFLGFVAVLLDAVFLVGFLLFAIYVSAVIISFVVGRWLLQRFQPSLAEGRILPLVLGLALFVIVSAIPVLGDLVGFVVLLLGLGALWFWLRQGRQQTTAVAA